MKKRIALLVLLFALVIFALFLLVPRTYNAPEMQLRTNTQYWELSTHSRIAYTLIASQEDKKTTPIIFLQGGPGGPIYDRTIQSLTPLAEDGYDVYLYDQIGCGFSDRLSNIEEYTAERHTQDLDAIITTIGAEKVILIGQSWGAILATLYIADHPEKVEKVIFTGPGPMYPVNEQLAAISAPDSLHMKQPAFTNADANQKASNLRSKFVTLLARIFGIKLASDKEMDQYQDHLDGLNKATVCDPDNAPQPEAGGGFYSQMMTMKSLQQITDPRPMLKDAKIPALIMKGQCDNQKWGYVTEYLELFPNHQLIIIPDAGHSISIEQPERYLQTIRDYLAH